MTILVIGGTGKTGSPLARILHASGHKDLLLTSRSGRIPPPFANKGVSFDWFIDATHQNPFKTGKKIEKIYLVIPEVMNPLPFVTKFLDLAKRKGVKRFVFLSGSASAKGEAPHGQVHEYLANMRDIEYAVLKPTWFHENFAINFLESIRQHNEVFSVAKDGKIPFVAAEDIALAAADALTCAKSWNGERYIIGPELLSYDDVAELLSKVLRRTIKHRRITFAQECDIWMRLGFARDYAAWLVRIEEGIAKGSEEKIAHNRQSIVGKKSLKEYFEANRHLWMI